jgi:uncharacterized membrane protein
MLFAVGGGIISLVAVVFSLLFLTVQFASTALSPRLNLFRDAPIVWHAFGLFVGVFVFATCAALRTSKREEMSVVIPIATIALALAAMVVARNLQLRAFRSVQIGPHSARDHPPRPGGHRPAVRATHRRARRLRGVNPARLEPRFRGWATTGTSATSRSVASCAILRTAILPSATSPIPTDTRRLLLHPPTWEDYVAAAVDELIEAGRTTPSVAARLVKVLDDLTAAVPADRRNEIKERRQLLTQ